jgi:dTDP-4-dehydrorhamnose reductase
MLLREKGGRVLEKILILGASGMLGHNLFYYLSKNCGHEVLGTVRSAYELSDWLPPKLMKSIRSGVDVNDFESIIQVIADFKPNIVINCIGIIKQVPAAQDQFATLTINALLPHKLALLCKATGARLIHVSTDCVFDGARGKYLESDISNATDLYGRTKFLGEVRYPHCVTLRTSIIGHELKGKNGLVEWLLSQEGSVRGFTKAIFSGFPTVELSRIIKDYVLPNLDLKGLYHLSAEPISKFELLRLIISRYNKKIELKPDSGFESDRSLDSSLFRSLTGYTPPSWPQLIEQMYLDYTHYPHN